MGALKDQVFQLRIDWVPLGELSNDLIEDLPCLRLKNVSFTWPNGIKVLDNCSFSIPRQGLWMLVGTNGSGKSTLFKLLNGMLEINSGYFSCTLKPSLMFQNPDHQLLMPSCRSDLMLGLPRCMNETQRRTSIKKALDQVGMEGMQSRPIHTLSGGQKQRLALAGALVSGANLLLLDEPTALLDPISQSSVLETVQKLTSCENNPIAALWITHRLEELKYCDGAAIMENGRVGPFSSGQDLMNRLKPLAGR